MIVNLKIIIETCEIDRGGFSYTFDTVNYIYENYDVNSKLGPFNG